MKNKTFITTIAMLCITLLIVPLILSCGDKETVNNYEYSSYGYGVGDSEQPLPGASVKGDRARDGILANNVRGGTHTVEATQPGTNTAKINFPNGGEIQGTPTLTGDWTSSGSPVIDWADINGGAIDGTTIGANSAAAGTFTTLTVTNIAGWEGGIADISATGTGTVTHTLGGTPSSVLVDYASLVSSGSNVRCIAPSGSMAATTFKFRCYTCNADGGLTKMSTSGSISWIATKE